MSFPHDCKNLHLGIYNSFRPYVMFYMPVKADLCLLSCTLLALFFLLLVISLLLFVHTFL